MKRASKRQRREVLQRQKQRQRIVMGAIIVGGARLAANVGTSAMPAYKDSLTNEDITAVLVYIKSTWPIDIQATQGSR